MEFKLEHELYLLAYLIMGFLLGKIYSFNVFLIVCILILLSWVWFAYKKLDKDSIKKEKSNQITYK